MKEKQSMRKKSPFWLSPKEVQELLKRVPQDPVALDRIVDSIIRTQMPFHSLQDLQKPQYFLKKLFDVYRMNDLLSQRNNRNDPLSRDFYHELLAERISHLLGHPPYEEVGRDLFRIYPVPTKQQTSIQRIGQILTGELLEPLTIAKGYETRKLAKTRAFVHRLTELRLITYRDRDQLNEHIDRTLQERQAQKFPWRMLKILREILRP